MSSEIKIGARVRVVRIEADNGSHLIGREGAVRGITRTRWPVEVELDGADDDEVRLYSCDELEVV